MCAISQIYFHPINPENPLIEVHQIPAVKDLIAKGCHIVKVEVQHNNPTRGKAPVPTSLTIYFLKENMISKFQNILSETYTDVFSLLAKKLQGNLHVMKDKSGANLFQEIIKPEAQEPETEGTEQPEAQEPETEGTEQPEAQEPETEGTEQPEAQGRKARRRQRREK